MKSILLHIYDDIGLESRLQAAFDLARAFEGHLTCLHATPFEDYLTADPFVVAALPEEFSEKMKKRRLELQARVEARIKLENIQWDWVHVDEPMAAALIRHSVLNDIIILSLSAEPAFLKTEPRPLAGAVSTGAGTPVLAIPQSSGPQSSGKLDLTAPMVIAWNGSAEAALAMRLALPFLQMASAVHVLEVEEKISRYPRDLAARYLARHGVESEIVQQKPVDGSISEAIRKSAAELGAGLIVMGAYGHSRLREFLLGGVTRDLVMDSNIPLFLGH
jgi:nucleotide-binding universal stress UspA family protein